MVVGWIAARGALARARLDFDRTLTERERAHEAKVSSLLTQIHMRPTGLSPIGSDGAGGDAGGDAGGASGTGAGSSAGGSASTNEQQPGLQAQQEKCTFGRVWPRTNMYVRQLCARGILRVEMKTWKGKQVPVQMADAYQALAQDHLSRWKSTLSAPGQERLLQVATLTGAVLQAATAPTLAATTPHPIQAVARGATTGAPRRQRQKRKRKSGGSLAFATPLQKRMAYAVRSVRRDRQISRRLLEGVKFHQLSAYWKPNSKHLEATVEAAYSDPYARPLLLNEALRQMRAEVLTPEAFVTFMDSDGDRMNATCLKQFSQFFNRRFHQWILGMCKDHGSLPPATRADGGPTH